jgi:hypothetical protein
MSFRLENILLNDTINDASYMFNIYQYDISTTGPIGPTGPTGSIGPIGPTGPIGSSIISITGNSGPISNNIVTFNPSTNVLSYNTGPVGAGLFTLEVVPNFTDVEILTPTSVKSVSNESINQFNGRIQSIQKYTTPSILSFQVDSSTCIIGFSSDPTSKEDRYFNASFYIDIDNKYSIYYGPYTSVNIGNWNSSDIFSIIYDGTYFNYFQNDIQVFQNIDIKNDGPYYFTASLTNSNIINVTNINFAPYSKTILNTSSYQISTSWSGDENLIKDINNTYIITPGSVIQTEQYYGSENQGFIFSFPTFTNTDIDKNSLYYITNDSINFNIYLRNYKLFVQTNLDNSSNYNCPYIDGDIIQLYFDTEKFYLYQNNILKYSIKKTNFISNRFKAYIQNQTDENIIVVNPLFYPYYINSNILPQGEYYSDYLFWNTNTNNWKSDGSRIHIGSGAGQYNQSTGGISIGTNAGFTGQGKGSISIGNNAGSYSQGDYSIAIGNQAGQTQQISNSIILNASATGFACESTGFYVNPINNDDTSSLNIMRYNTLTNEITYMSAPTQLNPEKYSSNYFLESPDSGVYYRGEGEIINNEYIKIILPEYVSRIASNFTIQITCIYDGNDEYINHKVSKINDNNFLVYGKNSKFYWSVHGIKK